MHCLSQFCLLVADVSSDVFWRTPFTSLCDHRQLTEFYVLHIEPTTKPGQAATVKGSATNLSEKVSTFVESLMHTL